MTEGSIERAPETPIREFGASDIFQFARAGEYIRRLVERGPEAYIDNARVAMRALDVDGMALPLVLTDGRAGNANICSARSHFIQYAIHQYSRGARPARRAVFRVTLRSVDAAMRLFSVGRIAYVNNWLLTTNPTASLSVGQIRRITAFLQEKHPGHAIVFRSVNPSLHGEFAGALRSCGRSLLKSRIVYLLDPSSPAFLRRSQPGRDFRLLDRTSHEICRGDAISPEDMPRLAELYRALYLRKHFHLNPGLRPEFFQLTVGGELLEFRAFRKDGRIDAFVSFHANAGVMTGVYIGYDLEAPRRTGLYRQAVALLIREAMERGLILNLSAGAGVFKALRGARPVFEYDAVYDAHLPRRQRLVWKALKAMTDRWTFASENLPRIEDD